jgi:hypothetical protein
MPCSSHPPSPDHSKTSKTTHVGLHYKCPLLLSVLSKIHAGEIPLRVYQISWKSL